MASLGEIEPDPLRFGDLLCIRTKRPTTWRKYISVRHWWRRRRRANAEYRPFTHHVHGHQPLLRFVMGKVSMVSRQRIVGDGDQRALAREPMRQLGHLPRMVLIHGHDQAARIRLLCFRRRCNSAWASLNTGPAGSSWSKAVLRRSRWRSNVSPSSNVARCSPSVGQPGQFPFVTQGKESADIPRHGWVGIAMGEVGLTLTLFVAHIRNGIVIGPKGRAGQGGAKTASAE